MTGQGDHKDHRDHEYRGNCQLLSLDQKEKRPFCLHDDAEKCCEIHLISGHDLEECETFLDRKEMPPPAAQVAQEPRQSEHRQANHPNNDEQMGEINVIFRGRMFITSKTKEKELEWKISLA
jgi:hypothetical protein